MFGAKTRDHEFFEAFIKHADLGVAASKKIAEMFDDISRAKELSEEIKSLESQGDTITHQTVKRLHETWITPLERADIHQLVSALDDVLDLDEAVAERVLLFGVRKTRPTAQALAHVLVKSAEALAKAIHMLPEVSKKSSELLALCVEINSLENEADKLYRRALGELFNRRDDGQSEPPRPATTPDDVLEIMKWREIYDFLENATDRCEDVANILEGIVLEYA